MAAACRVVLKRPESAKRGFDANDPDQTAAASVRQGLFSSDGDEDGGHSRADAMKKVVVPARPGEWLPPVRKVAPAPWGPHTHRPPAAMPTFCRKVITFSPTHPVGCS